MYGGLLLFLLVIMTSAYPFRITVAILMHFYDNNYYNSCNNNVNKVVHLFLHLHVSMNTDNSMQCYHHYLVSY